MTEKLTRKAALWRYGGSAFLVGVMVALGVIQIVEEEPTPTAPTTSVAPSTTPPAATTTAKVTAPAADWSKRLLSSGESPPTIHFGFHPDHDYSLPVYDARTATTCREVRAKAATFVGLVNIPRGECVPSNDAWRPSRGFDGFMIVYNPDTGEEIDFWNVTTPGQPFDPNNHAGGCATWSNFLSGYDPNRMLCAASAIRITGPDGKPADVRTYTGNSPAASGGGIHNLRGLLRPADVRAGTMNAPIKAMIPNTMFGPECSTAERDDPTKFGITCGSAVAPAGQFEGAAKRDADTAVKGSTVAQRMANTVPEGMVFRYRISDSELERWLDQRGYTGQLRITAATIVRFLRDRGLIITDTQDSPGILLQADSGDPQAWRDLGIVGTGGDLLAGLPFTADRLDPQSPATNLCADGQPSTWYCWASASEVGR